MGRNWQCCAVQHNWRHSLANAMHVIMDKLCHWLQQAPGCQWFAKQQGMRRVCEASCLLPPGEFSFAASGTSGMQPLVGLEKLLVGDQSQIVVLAAAGVDVGFLIILLFVVVWLAGCQSGIGAQQTELGSRVTLGTPHLLVGCSITQHASPGEVEAKVTGGMLQLLTCQWTSHWIAEDGLEDDGHHLGHTMVHGVDGG